MSRVKLKILQIKQREYKIENDQGREVVSLCKVRTGYRLF